MLLQALKSPWQLWIKYNTLDNSIIMRKDFDTIPTISIFRLPQIIIYILCIIFKNRLISISKPAVTLILSMPWICNNRFARIYAICSVSFQTLVCLKMSIKAILNQLNPPFWWNRRSILLYLSFIANAATCAYYFLIMDRYAFCLDCCFKHYVN